MWGNFTELVLMLCKIIRGPGELVGNSFEA